MKEGAEEQMIEIVFNESAAGSLKIAQSYGKGKYRGGATSVFIIKKDGSEPTEEEKEAPAGEAVYRRKLRKRFLMAGEITDG